MYNFLLALVLALSSSVSFANDLTGVALVYRGPGACEDGCWQAAAAAAERTGLQVQFVGPEEKDPALFVGPKIWIQPGGKSSTASKAMIPDLKQNLRSFVSSGGGYVGFCAGGFIATQFIADRGVEGFGILPGRNALYSDSHTNDHDPAQLTIHWNGKDRDMYWEGGPYFILEPSDPFTHLVEITATYPDGRPASVRTQFGAGRVYVTGVHPEAPPDWRWDGHLTDSDGVDYDLSEEMIQWAIAPH